ncbi:MAG: FAD-binding oxidoreductase [Eubacteriales bacterium]|nr:FAD-binding oxidoreductase [Eubacteriales bacterium]
MNLLKMSSDWKDYLHDESKLEGAAESISFPKTEQEIAEVIAAMNETQTPITIQGGKTGIVGAAVPAGGHIMNLSEYCGVERFEATEEGGLLTVRAGTRLDNLNQEIARLTVDRPLFFPSQPTETTATIGGVAATAASGIQAFGYGNASQYVSAVRVMDKNGTITEQTGEALQDYLGSEGMLGVILSVTIRLLPVPTEQWGIAFFFPEHECAWKFADFIQGTDVASETATITVAEYIGQAALAMLEKRKSQMSKLDDIPPVPEGTEAMIYLEIAGEEDGVEEIAGVLMEAAAELGSDPDQAWALSGESEMEGLRVFRHVIPETANLLVEENHRNDAQITKLSTDYGFSKASFSQMMCWYEEQMQDWTTERIVFGHIGGSHVHWNFFPKTAEEYQDCLTKLKWLAINIRLQGGCAAQENGFGKLKRKWIPVENFRMGAMRRLKQQYDPQCFWNPQNYY